MQSILSKSGLFNSQLVMLDDEGRIDEQIELIVEELRAHVPIMRERGRPSDEMMRKVDASLGSEFEEELFAAWTDRITIHTYAAFALGYYTAKHPEWLIFRQTAEAHTPSDDD